MGWFWHERHGFVAALARLPRTLCHFDAGHHNLLAGVDGDGREHVGLGNVDDRLRSVFGDDYGLVVETAVGAGTKVSLRIPKFHAGVRAG